MRTSESRNVSFSPKWIRQPTRNCYFDTFVRTFREEWQAGGSANQLERLS
jgi:hypothetical protein